MEEEFDSGEEAAHQLEALARVGPPRRNRLDNSGKAMANAIRDDARKVRVDSRKVSLNISFRISY